MVVRLSAVHASCPLPPGRFVVLISDRGWVDPSAIVQLEKLDELKNQGPHGILIVVLNMIVLYQGMSCGRWSLMSYTKCRLFTKSEFTE
jgi:hypothetical protein